MLISGSMREKEALYKPSFTKRFVLSPGINDGLSPLLCWPRSIFATRRLNLRIDKVMLRKKKVPQVPDTSNTLDSGGL